MTNEIIAIYTYNENCTRGGEVCHYPIMKDEWIVGEYQSTSGRWITGDVTEWLGTHEELVAEHLPRARRETGRPDFGRTVSRNILAELGVDVEVCEF